MAPNFISFYLSFVTELIAVQYKHKPESEAVKCHSQSDIPT